VRDPVLPVCNTLKEEALENLKEAKEWGEECERLWKLQKTHPTTWKEIWAQTHSKEQDPNDRLGYVDDKFKTEEEFKDWVKDEEQVDMSKVDMAEGETDTKIHWKCANCGQWLSKPLWMEHKPVACTKCGAKDEPRMGQVRETVKDNPTSTTPTEHVTLQYDRPKEEKEPFPNPNSFGIEMKPREVWGEECPVCHKRFKRLREHLTSSASCRPKETTPTGREMKVCPKCGHNVSANHLDYHMTTVLCREMAAKNERRQAKAEKRRQKEERKQARIEQRAKARELAASLDAFRCSHCHRNCRTEEAKLKHEAHCKDNPNRIGPFDKTPNLRPKKEKKEGEAEVNVCPDCGKIVFGMMDQHKKKCWGVPVATKKAQDFTFDDVASAMTSAAIVREQLEKATPMPPLEQGRNG
jgi:DNA-directed RNA polymerase subunit RPC12/RpoP